MWFDFILATICIVLGIANYIAKNYLIALIGVIAGFIIYVYSGCIPKIIDVICANVFLIKL